MRHCSGIYVPDAHFTYDYKERPYIINLLCYNLCMKEINENGYEMFEAAGLHRERDHLLK